MNQAYERACARSLSHGIPRNRTLCGNWCSDLRYKQGDIVFHPIKGLLIGWIVWIAWQDNMNMEPDYDSLVWDLFIHP